MEDVILQAENLSFSYEGKGGPPALDGLSLSVRRGSKVALMGANGAGKSTFFLCCNGICKPSGGRLLLHGQPLRYDRKSLRELRRRVGIVFQDPDQQLFSASVWQEISFGILNLGATEEQARREVERVMRELEIEPFRDRPTHALSGGQKKQVAIADVLVMHPELILLDEPAAALDPRHTALVRGIVDGLTRQGITVLMATHDVDYACQWADEILLLDQGRLLAQGSPEWVFRQPELLAKAHLEPPGALHLFDALTARGILPQGLAAPRSLAQLEQCLLRELAPEGLPPSKP